jgi:hypothetical protein
MKTTHLLILCLVVLVAAGVWLARAMGHRDERVIRKTLDRLREAGEMSGTESTIVAAATAREIGAYFTDDVRVTYRRLPVPISGRRQFEQVAFQVRSRADRIDIRLKNVSLDLERGSTNAVMRLAARIAVSGMGRSDSTWDEFELRWNKRDGDWKIAAVRPVETIRMP